MACSSFLVCFPPDWRFFPDFWSCLGNYVAVAPPLWPLGRSFPRCAPSLPFVHASSLWVLVVSLCAWCAARSFWLGCPFSCCLLVPVLLLLLSRFNHSVALSSIDVDCFFLLAYLPPSSPEWFCLCILSRFRLFCHLHASFYLALCLLGMSVVFLSCSSLCHLVRPAFFFLLDASGSLRLRVASDSGVAGVYSQFFQVLE